MVLDPKPKAMNRCRTVSKSRLYAYVHYTQAYKQACMCESHAVHGMRAHPQMHNVGQKANLKTTVMLQLNANRTCY